MDAGATREGLVLDAGEVLISLRSDDVWGAIALDREVNESGRVSLLRRVLRRLRDDGYISIRPTHRRDTARDTQTGTRRDTPATVVRFLKFRDNLWPANEDATRGTTRESTRKATHRIGTILAVDPADPFPASATTSSCPAWNDLSAELRRHVRPDLYERWFAPLTASQSGEELVLLAPNPFHKSFVEDNFRAFLEQALATKSRGAVRVRVAAELLS
ncbi:MAG: DnaA N-terminal domain-containing protein [Anaeromyxobacteraceae bacterium]